MEFSYFNLFDNHYRDNPRSANQALLDGFDQAKWADRIGMHCAWLGERHCNYFGVQGNPNALMAGLIGSTRRIRIGSAVNVLPMHHPLRLAEEIATLDVLSGGRINFGCGRGTVRKEFECVGASWDRRTELFAESLDIVMKAWAETQDWNYQGHHYQIDDVTVVPRPRQRPIPVYIGSSCATSMEDAARRNVNLLMSVNGTQRYGGLGNAIAQYERFCEKYKHPRGRVAASWFTHVGDTPQELARGREYLMYYLKESYIGAAVFPTSMEGQTADAQEDVRFMQYVGNLTADTLSEQQFLQGSTQQIIDTLKKAEESGLDEVLLYVSFGRKPHQLVKDQMQHVMEEIAPLFEGSHNFPQNELKAG